MKQIYDFQVLFKILNFPSPKKRAFKFFTFYMTIGGLKIKHKRMLQVFFVVVVVFHVAT